MAETDQGIQAHGRVFITGSIEAVTGIHIRGSRLAGAVGGLDSAVTRDPATGRPYIPGSSLKGKLRSLLEKHYNKSMQWSADGVRIHVCYKFDEKGKRVPDKEAYARCEVCPIFGTPAEFGVMPTRLIVRDVPLHEDSAQRLSRSRTGLPFTEVKWETALDRVTATAIPRPLERVPAGAVFAPMEMVYTVYDEADLTRLPHVLDSMHLLQDDYLGGQGSRGSGKVVFRDVRLSVRARDRYSEEAVFDEGLALDALIEREKEVITWLHEKLLS